MASCETPLDVVKRFLANFERKQRNLMKRKGKLDQYREKLAKGQTLNEEQKKAVEGFEGVMQNIIMVQEVLTQSKELVDDVTKAVAHEHSQLEHVVENKTLSFLQIHICLLRLLESLDSSDLRLMITRSSSEHHLKMLDTVRNLVTAPLIKDWPGTSSTCLNKAQDFLQSHSKINAPAQFTYDFVMGRQVAIPVPANYEGPLKKFNFREARALCFRLLATPAIQRLMSPSEETNIITQEHVEEICADEFTKEVTEDEHETEEMNVPVVHSSEDIDSKILESVPKPEEPCPVVLNNVIKPLGGTFNFLQASSVVAPSFLSTPTPLEFHPSTDVQNGTVDVVEQLPEQIPSVEKTYCTMEHVAKEMTSIPTGANLDEGSKRYTEPQPRMEKKFEHNSTVESEELTTEVSTSSKPLSYADLLRRPGGQGRHRGGLHQEQPAPSSGGKLERISSANGKDDDDTDRPPMDSGIARNQSRGGRGNTRGYTRGSNVSGPARRAVGGSRANGRFMNGRGSAAYRGTNSIAQPSY